MSNEENPETEEAEEVETDSATEAENESPPEGDDDASDWRTNFDPDKARDKIRKQNSELKGLRERTKAAENKAKGVDEGTQRIAALEATTMRYEVAFDIGLPKELVPRLQGNTKEEFLADAEALLELVTPAKRPPSKRPAENLRGGGDPEREPEETDLSKIGARMFKH